MSLALNNWALVGYRLYHWFSLYISYIFLFMFYSPQRFRFKFKIVNTWNQSRCSVNSSMSMVPKVIEPMTFDCIRSNVQCTHIIQLNIRFRGMDIFSGEATGAKSWFYSRALFRKRLGCRKPNRKSHKSCLSCTKCRKIYQVYQFFLTRAQLFQASLA